MCQYWPSATWWAVYFDGELLDVYPNRSLAAGYAEYMSTPDPALGHDGEFANRPKLVAA